MTDYPDEATPINPRDHEADSGHTATEHYDGASHIPNFRERTGFSDLTPGDRGPDQPVLNRPGKTRRPLPSGLDS